MNINVIKVDFKYTLDELMIRRYFFEKTPVYMFILWFFIFNQVGLDYHMRLRRNHVGVNYRCIKI